MPGYFAEAELTLDAITPPLDISGISEIQRIPIGGSKLYFSEKLCDEGEVSKEMILNSIANLAVMQLDLERFTTVKDPATGEIRDCMGGEFGRIIRGEILWRDPKHTLFVKHIELVQTPGLTPEFDEDIFELWINDRRIELGLARDMGKPEKGFEWGLGLLMSERYVPKSGKTSQD